MKGLIRPKTITLMLPHNKRVAIPKRLEAFFQLRVFRRHAVGLVDERLLTPGPFERSQLQIRVLIVS